MPRSPAPRSAPASGPGLRLADAPQALDANGRWVELAASDALLLAWLALQGATPRERMAALLWPDSAPEAARNALRQRLFRLRKQLGRDVVSGTALLELTHEVTHEVSHNLAGAATLLGELAASDAPELSAWLARERTQRQAQSRQGLESRIAALEAADRKSVV